MRTLAQTFVSIASGSFFAVLALVAITTDCHSKPKSDSSIPEKNQEKLNGSNIVLPYSFVHMDGGNATDCGTNNATCGTWECQSGQPSGSCVSKGTHCGYVSYTDAAPRRLCGAVCCNAASCSGTTCEDAGNAHDAAGTDACGITLGCSAGGSQLANRTQGSAALSVPGGVFCPGVPAPVNLLADPSHCGACNTPCGSGYFCIGGFCSVP
jgi:hypothetical protein